MGKPFPMQSQLSDDLAQRLADADQEISEQYGLLGKAIQKTRQVAITYMHLTPNQIEKDESDL